MSKGITHICARTGGGVSDFVDLCLEHETNSLKLILEKETANKTILSSNCLLHYSGYGYAKRGAPLWLLKKIEQDRSHIKSLGVYFHELYATGPLWSSAFWLSPAQQMIARRLVEKCDYWVTNREGSAEWLCKYAHNKPYAVLPVFSNVGEMISYNPIRTPRIVVFGGAPLRKATYYAAGNALLTWLESQQLELHDIGAPIEDKPTSTFLKNAGAIIHGRLSASEVSSIMADARYGVVRYPVDYVSKSGVFAAYCAHGVCPILLSKHYNPSDGLYAGKHYLDRIPPVNEQSPENIKIGHAAWEWYQKHRVSIQISVHRNLFQRGGGSVD